MTRDSFRSSSIPQMMTPPARGFKNEAHERAWMAKARAAQAAAEAAAEKYPAGTKLHVTSARGLPRRSRAGLTFNDKASTEVTVVDKWGAELEAAQKSEAVVSPLGAAAIMNDEGLYKHGGAVSLAAQAAHKEELSARDQEIERLRAELARRDAAAANDGRPTRLGVGGKAPKAGDKPSEDFGGDDTKADKAK